MMDMITKTSEEFTSTKAPDAPHTSSGLFETVERQTWIRHNGVDVCCRDGRNLSGEESHRLARLHMDWVQDTELRDIRFLIDITDSIVDREVLRLYKESARDYRKKFHKIAVIGAKGILQYFCIVVNNFSGIGARFFDSREKALDWLAE